MDRLHQTGLIVRLSPGFHPNLPSAVYHADDICADPSLSSSLAQVLLRESPRKAWFLHPKLNPNYVEDQDEKFDLGRAAHAALLEGAAGVAVIDPSDYPSKTGSIPDGWTNNAIRAARDAARALGKTPILRKHFDSVQRMVDVALEFIAQSEIADYWGDAQSEVTAVICEGKTPVWLRCRFDRITTNRKVAIDYKSTADASPDVFSRLLVRMGYHIQEAFYRRVARTLGVEGQRFVFLAQSVEPPYECSLHGCDPALQEIADFEVERAVRLWRQCLTENAWPSYGGRIHWAMPTNAMMAEHELRLQEAA